MGVVVMGVAVMGVAWMAPGLGRGETLIIAQSNGAAPLYPRSNWCQVLKGMPGLLTQDA